MVSRDERPVQREKSTNLADALPHSDGGGVAARTAADEQHRACGFTGARGCARWYAVTAHGFLRRGPCIAYGRSGTHCAAHATDYRLRVRSHADGGPSGRVLFLRSLDGANGKWG